MSRSARNTNAFSWFVVLVVGVVVLAVVAGLQLFQRLDAGQDVLDGARPAFTEERVAGARVGITMVDSITNMADPIVDAEGGAADEVIPLVELIAAATGLEPADVLTALEENFPHTYHLLLALPLSEVSAEITELLTFVADNSDLADADAVLAAIAENTPNLHQAIVNLIVVTDGWRAVPGTENLTRFDGSDVSSVPDVRDYFAADVITAIETTAQDFRELDDPWLKVDQIPIVLTVIGLVVVVLGLLMMVLARRGPYSKGIATTGWSVVAVVGVLVAVLGVGLYTRLDAGQDLLDGLRPAFEEERIVGMEVGITMVDSITNMADPIVDAEGGAADEVIPLVELIAAATGLEPADVLTALEENFPHTYHLLLALPLSEVSAEITELLTFVADNSDLADADAVLAAIAENTPNLHQAIVNLIVVTDGWRAVPGTENLTRFDGSDVSSVPDVRDYFAADVITAVRFVAVDYRTLDTTAPPVDVFPPLLLIVGLLVLTYGVAMLTVTRVTAPRYTDPEDGSAADGSADPDGAESVSPAPAGVDAPG